MEDLRIAAVQAALVWESPAANRAHLSARMAQISGADLVVLPEMFTTGFSMNAAHIAEAFHDEMETLQWMRSEARVHQAVITGSVSVGVENHYYNRLLWVRPDGSYSSYDKRHLFSMAAEHEHYTPGIARTIEEVKGWKVLPLICYDLRFPELARNISIGDAAAYDALIYVANWPQVRRHPWSALLVARAIENQAYTVGVNIVGTDGNGHEYSGDSVILDPRGELLTGAAAGAEQVVQATLSWRLLKEFRERFPVLKDRVL